MTITLAAVYTPIGLQGGLTGALFREFAFTLAGAVFISGVVALTLSPMMSANLLTAEDEQHWLPAAYQRRFRPLRGSTAVMLDGTLSARPAVYMVWVDAVAAGGPDVDVLGRGTGAERGSGRDLRHRRRAGERDDRPDQPLRRRCQRVFQSMPETEFTFQITFPDHGLRRNGAEAVGRAQTHRVSDPAGGPAKAAGAFPASRCFRSRRPRCPAAASFRSSSSSPRPPSPRKFSTFAEADAGQGDAERHVRLPADHRRQDRPAAVAKS